MVGIPGTPLDLSNVPPGCRFAERCFKATEHCHHNEPALIHHEKRGWVACHQALPLPELKAQSRPVAEAEVY